MKSLTILDQARATFLAPIEQELQNALPATVDARRFQAAFITAVQNNPRILQCDPDSVRNSLMKCASDGLVPDGKQAALVPFKDNKSGKLLAQYIPMYQGILARMHELGDVLSTTVECVYKNDKFDFDWADMTSTSHTSTLNSDRGEIIGAYVIFKDKENRVLHREIMDRGEIDNARNFSRASDSPAWKNSYGEMARKTVIRRGAKYIPMSDALRKIIEREDEYVAFDRSERPDRGTFNPLVIDAAPTHEPDKIEDSDQATPALRHSGGGRSETVPRQSGTGTTSPDSPEAPGPSSSLPTGWAHAYIAALKRAAQPKSLPLLAGQFWKQYGGFDKQHEVPKAVGRQIYDAFTECLGGKMDFKELAAKLREVVGDDDAPNADAKEKVEQDVDD